MEVLVFTAPAQELWTGLSGAQYTNIITSKLLFLHILSIILFQFLMFLTNFLHITPLKYRFLVAWEKKKSSGFLTFAGRLQT